MGVSPGYETGDVVFSQVMSCTSNADKAKNATAEDECFLTGLAKAALEKPNPWAAPGPKNGTAVNPTVKALTDTRKCLRCNKCYSLPQYQNATDPMCTTPSPTDLPVPM